MKQRITQQQFEELTVEQRLKYLAWISEKLGLETDPDVLALIYKEKLVPQGRSIGELIWFLDEQNTGYWYIQRSGERKAWYVQFVALDYDDLKMELVDILWEAVKAVLT